MNTREFFERVATLERDGEAFALATVVVRRSPVSSHLGDRAIVFADGRMEGFVGGSCSRDVVRRYALDAIQCNRARLLQIRPETPREPPPAGMSETIVIPMGCASEGAVDVYLEPHVPPSTLLVAGFTPVADALVRLGTALDSYRVTRVVSAEELRDLDSVDGVDVLTLDALTHYLAGTGRSRRLVAIIASQGHYDETVLEAVLTAGAPAFVGLLASRKRAADVLGILEQQGVTREALAAVRAPVGLDLGARTPSDVAVSILAEIVAANGAQADPAAQDHAGTTAQS